MNPLTDLIFTLSWFALLIWAVRSIIKGFTSKPVRNYNAGTWTTEVTKRIPVSYTHLTLPTKA